MVRRGQNLRGPYGYVITQVYRKVPITINPVHRSRASQHPWLPERSTKLAVGASGGVLPPHSHYKQGQYSRFLRPVVAYGDGYSSPPIPGDCLYLHMETHPLRNNFTAGTRGSFFRGNIQGTFFQEYLGNIHSFTEHSGNNQRNNHGTFSEHSVNIQC